MKKTDISERISVVIAHNNVSINKFALQLGYKRAQSVYDIVNGKVLPSFDFLFKFVSSEYSENINIRWLISGEGEMLLNDATRLEEPVDGYSKTEDSFSPAWLQYVKAKDQKMIEMAEEMGRLRYKLATFESGKLTPETGTPFMGKDA